MTKLIGCAYATSDIATRWGFGKQGCWYVAERNPVTYAETVIAAYATRPEAWAHCERINLPLDRYSFPEHGRYVVPTVPAGWESIDRADWRL